MKLQYISHFQAYQRKHSRFLFKIGLIFKKITIKIVIYFLKILINLKKGTLFLLFKGALLFKILTRIILKMGGKFIVLKIYRLYLLYIKKRLVFLSKTATNKLNFFLASRYLIHLTLILIFFIGIINNFNDKKVPLGSQTKGQKSLLFTLVSSETEIITEEYPVNYIKESYFNYPAIMKPALTKEVFQEQIVELPSLSWQGDALLKPIIPTTETTIPPRSGIVYYEIMTGDTIGLIAQKFGININTILWENNLQISDYIRPGDKLAILPVSGIKHKVKKGETVEMIAQKYKADVNKILAFNKIENHSLYPNQILIIPEGRLPLKAPPSSYLARLKKFFIPPSLKVAPGIKMVWPTIGRRITQYFNWRHGGLDIDGDYTSPIYTSMEGKVEFVGRDRGYGLRVIIAHSNGLSTSYAHLSKLFVQKGDLLKKGQTIGIMGSTGRSTGSHLDFRLIKNGRFLNPLSYLR